MSSFSPTDAALEGVRLSRERPRTLFVWASYYFLFTFLLSLVAIITLGAHAAELVKEAQQSNIQAAEFDRLLTQLWPFVAVGYPLLLIFQVMFTAALYRTILSPDHHPNISLRIGGDEFRLFLISIVKTLIFALALFGELFIVIFDGVGASFVPAMLGVILSAALFLFALFVSIRLSTIRRGHLRRGAADPIPLVAAHPPSVLEASGRLWHGVRDWGGRLCRHVPAL